MEKRIEIWFTQGNQKKEYYKVSSQRDFIEVKSLSEAVRECKRLTKENKSEICIDITYFDNDHDLIENKSRWYYYRDGKLKQI